MNILKAEELNKKLMERYDEHPLGWRYFYGRDAKGNYNIIMANVILGEQYWLKFSSPYGCNHISVGVKADLNEEFPFLKDPSFDKDFGLRPLNITNKEMSDVLRGKKSMLSVISKRGNEAKNDQPVSRDEVNRPFVIVGPYPASETNLESISPSQIELNRKMEEEMARLGNKYLRYIS